jgi:hypothetical protein
MTKTYYELLGLPRTASFEDVKHAFRREIAKYHPDKVQHLGHEFEEIAASKAAVLTQAYKTLGDPDARAEYDARIGDPAHEPTVAPPSSPSTGEPSASSHERPLREATADPAPTSHPVDTPAWSRAAEQDGKANEVVRRATVLRFRQALEVEFGPQDQSAVTGFDVACAPSKSGLFAKYPPRVLGRVVAEVDAAAIAETWGLAARTASGRPRDICVFVIGPIVAPPGELAAAIKKERAKPGPAGGKLVVIPVNSRSWHAHIPTDAPPVVKSLVERLKSA